MDLEPYNIGDIVLYDLSRYSPVDIPPLPVLIVGFYTGHIIAVPHGQWYWPWPFFHTWPLRQILEPWYITEILDSVISPATPDIFLPTTRAADDDTEDESETGGW